MIKKTLTLNKKKEVKNVFTQMENATSSGTGVPLKQILSTPHK